MSDYTAIENVSETLIDLLRDKLADFIDPDSIMLISPGDIEGTDTVRLSLFLYQVDENVHMKNQEMEMMDSTIYRYPPLSLDLYYLLTPHPSTGIQDKTERTREEHRILGRAMQVFYDNSTLTGSILKGNLETNEELHVLLNPLNLDDITKIWSTFQERSFRTSVCYIVTPAIIDSIRKVKSERVVSKKYDYDQIVPERGEE